MCLHGCPLLMSFIHHLQWYMPLIFSTSLAGWSAIFIPFKWRVYALSTPLATWSLVRVGFSLYEYSCASRFVVMNCSTTLFEQTCAHWLADNARWLLSFLSYIDTSDLTLFFLSSATLSRSFWMCC